MPNPRCPLRGVPHDARQALPPLSPIHVPTSLPCAPLPCPEPCRDTNASDNVHKVFLQHVKDGTRPAYLRRPKPGSRASSGAGAGAGAGGSTPAAGAGTTGPGALGFHLKGDGWGSLSQFHSMQYHARCMARAARPHRGSPVPRVTIFPPPHTPLPVTHVSRGRWPPAPQGRQATCQGTGPPRPTLSRQPHTCRNRCQYQLRNRFASDHGANLSPPSSHLSAMLASRSRGWRGGESVPRV